MSEEQEVYTTETTETTDKWNLPPHLTDDTPSTITRRIADRVAELEAEKAKYIETATLQIKTYDVVIGELRKIVGE